MKKNKKEQDNEVKLEAFIEKIDQKKIADIKSEIEEYEKSLNGKEYAISFDKNLLAKFENFMNNDVEWRAKEALGVKEILKRIEVCKKEGIKDGVCYFTNLEAEASHYFLMKWAGKGSKDIEEFISLWKIFEETLILIQQDNSYLNELNQKLKAAEQGIELE